jgi:hypothetical protein
MSLAACKKVNCPWPPSVGWIRTEPVFNKLVEEHKVQVELHGRLRDEPVRAVAGFATAGDEVDEAKKRG